MQGYQIGFGISGFGSNVRCYAPTINARPPNRTLNDDVQQIRQLACKIIAEGQDIIGVLHSYGGVVGSSALAGLDKIETSGIGRVKGLVYMAAFLLFEEESLAAIFGGGLPSWLTPNDEGTTDISGPGNHFYSDLPEAEQIEWVKKLAVHPTVAQYDGPKEPVGKSAWRTIPTTYLMCSNDQALPIAVQEMMIDRLEKAQPNLSIRRKYCDAGHSPFLAAPEAAIEAVEVFTSCIFTFLQISSVFWGLPSGCIYEKTWQKA